ncbi:MAG: putative metal-binding motif-containing protein, partial [Myxococcota bacterium]
MATRSPAALFGLALLLAAGCGDGTASGTNPTLAVDADHDGYTTQVDCDDTDATVHPGAAEVVGDGIDQDCNGVDLQAGCPDADGDEAFSAACGGDDCNDASNAIYPSAVDVCGDTIDQDCSGVDLACPSDTTPPVLSGGLPVGTLAGGTTQATLRVTTNETATCKWTASAGTTYAAMTSTFTTTGSTSHNTVVTGLTDSASYTYYVRCQDGAGNATTSDYVVTFSVGTGTGPLSISLVTNRASGVAPLSVFFDASGTTSTGTTRPFHDLEYRWDFDDPLGSPVSGTTWATGSGAGVN